jgi:prevent-host-death family protein
MSTVSVRDLRNKGGEVLGRVEAGERITVTRDGRPVAELVPIARRPIPTARLIARWNRLRPVDPERLRADLDAVIDSSLW